ncbi:MAG: hypothetical protein U0599_03980 [Vicinamibacteria bacterium]
MGADAEVVAFLKKQPETAAFRGARWPSCGTCCRGTNARGAAT